MMKALGSEPANDLAAPTDEAIMSRYRDSGKPEDFNLLIKRYERELFRYLARYLGDASLAEDVFQNTFLQVHVKRSLYDDGRPFRPWLYAIATHQAVDTLRKAGRHPTLSLDQQRSGSDDADPGALIDLLVNEGVGPLAQLQQKERQEWVRESINRLPDTLKETLNLAYYQDLKYREIAEILQIPVGTVKSRLHAALAKLGEMAKASHRDEDG